VIASETNIENPTTMYPRRNIPIPKAIFAAAVDTKSFIVRNLVAPFLRWKIKKRAEKNLSPPFIWSGT
jgi:hypothetical protein